MPRGNTSDRFLLFALGVFVGIALAGTGSDVRNSLESLLALALLLAEVGLILAAVISPLIIWRFLRRHPR